ncbi:uncharacterized protein LOC135837335 [Planococcus citri]|uniref:uncharacterized protein LOC135837335 n=1 Tax=Planococcus citri TaxID=170843 RepID=UPI0031FA4523
MGSFAEVISTITFVFAAICTVQADSSQSNYSYDITKSLSSCIANLFCNAEPAEAEKFINRTENCDGISSEYEVAHEEEPFHNKLFYRVVNVSAAKRIIDYERSHVEFKFRDNTREVAVFSPKILYHIHSEVGAVKDTVYSRFHPVLYFLNLTIIATRRSKNFNEPDDVSLNYTYSWSSINFMHKTWYCEQISIDRKAELEKLFTTAVQSMFYKYVNVNYKNALDETFLSQPEKDLNSTHPQFLTNQQQHYYFIPSIPFYWFNLRNVIIKGLWNFYSLDINKTLSDTINTLEVKNVRGSLVLDYGCETGKPLEVNFTSEKNIRGSLILDQGCGTEKPLELNFIIDSFLISIDFLKNESNVEARDYKVIRTGSNIPITDRQAALIMRKVESAVALLIWPSMKTWKTSTQPSNLYESENIVEKAFAERTEKPDVKSLKILFNRWIPFNEN